MSALAAGQTLRVENTDRADDADAIFPTQSAPKKSGVESELKEMIVSEIREAARAAGVHVAIDGDDLLLAAPVKPPSALIDAMRNYKADIIALIRSGAWPASSAALLRHLDVEVVRIEDEAIAEREIAALLAQGGEIGVDIETAPLPEHSSDPQAALDPLRAEVRLLQLATESTALVIDLRKVPLSSPSVAAIWNQTLVGHNLSFDVKMLMANGVDLGAATIIDTILLSAQFLRGETNGAKEGSRRPSLSVAVREALGVELPKEMQKSDWSADELSDEQLAYAALDAVVALRLLARFRSDMERHQPGPDAPVLGLVDAHCGPNWATAKE